MKGGTVNQHALAQRAFFLKQFDCSVSHELVIRALDKLEDLRDASFYFQKGEEHRLRNQYALAISYYERALKIDGEHRDALFHLGLCYLGTSDRTTGEEVIDDVRLSTEERDKRAEFAYKRLIRILKRESTNAHYLCAAHINCSIALYQRRKYNEALDHCNQALHCREDYAPVYRRLAFIKLEMGLLEEALRNCERALDIDDRSEYSYNAHGLIRSAMGNSEGAIESFLAAIDRNRYFVYPYVNLNEEYRLLKRYPLAMAILDDALSLNGTYSDFYYFHAVTAEKMDNLEEAVTWYSKFLELVPTTSETFAEHIRHAHKRLKLLKACGVRD